MRLTSGCLAALAAWVVAGAAPAAVRLPGLFTDHMVLQRDAADAVWGWAGPGEKVTVTLNGKTASATADAKGKWRVDLPAQGAGGPFDLVVAASNTIALKDVLLGDVWVCAGQSNMEMGVNRCLNPAEEIAKSDHPNIRLFLVPRTQLGGFAKDDTGGQWQPCGPKSVRDFSGLGYLFARELHQRLGVPIGMIHACRGSTSITSWISREALDTVPDVAPMLRKYDAINAKLPELVEKYKKDLAVWNEAKAVGKNPGAFPEEPGPEKDMYFPSCVYNGQIHPLMPMTIKGLIWYHGEADIGNATTYTKLFPLLIRDWRTHWGQGDFPFLFVQLANFGDRPAEPGKSPWASMREIQAKALDQPKTAMAVAIDAGAKDWFPKDKRPVAERLALAACAVACGEKVEYVGPVFEQMKVDGAKAVVSFTHTGGGLAVKGDKLTGFSVAGDDGKYVWADAVIEGDTVVVSSPDVPKPVSVRYGWADDPECNLYSKAGLPAAPFRADH